MTLDMPCVGFRSKIPNSLRRNSPLQCRSWIACFGGFAPRSTRCIIPNYRNLECDTIHTVFTGTLSHTVTVTVRTRHECMTFINCRKPRCIAPSYRAEKLLYGQVFGVTKKIRSRNGCYRHKYWGKGMAGGLHVTGCKRYFTYRTSLKRKEE